MNEEYRNFCLRDAEWYQKKAEEAREAGEKDPEGYYKESLRCAQILCHVLPVIVKKSLESDEFKAAEYIYKFQSWSDLPKIRDFWNRTSVAGLDLLKGFIRVSSKLSQNITQLLDFGVILDSFSEYIRARG
jgi:hypothetical protein